MDKILGPAFPNQQDRHPTTVGRPHAPDTRFRVGAVVLAVTTSNEQLAFFRRSLDGM